MQFPLIEPPFPIWSTIVRIRVTLIVQFVILNARYSGDPNTRLVRYSDHGDLSDIPMVCYSDHHLNYEPIVRYSDAIWIPDNKSAIQMVIWILDNLSVIQMPAVVKSVIQMVP